MKKEKMTWVALVFIIAFILWTVAVQYVDVRTIGPENTRVGFAAFNLAFHQLTGQHWSLYILTDWLSILPLAFAAGFAVLGFKQWILRKRIRKVDRSLLCLGGMYIVLGILYCLFERIVINYRPVLIEGRLEASYPSSTTLLVLCIIPTAVLQYRQRIRNRWLRQVITIVLIGFGGLMVVGRTICGVHWFTDIIGALLLSAGLVGLYVCLTEG